MSKKRFSGIVAYEEGRGNGKKFGSFIKHTPCWMETTQSPKLLRSKAQKLKASSIRPFQDWRLKGKKGGKVRKGDQVTEKIVPLIFCRHLPIRDW